MPDLFIYLIKVNVALLIFCLGYYAVLRHLTFYNLNRVYLVTAIIFSTLYPRVDLTNFLSKHEELAKPMQVVIVNWQEPIKTITSTFLGHDVWYWLQAAFWLGVGLFAVRLIIQLVSLYRLHKQSEPVQLRQYMIRVIEGNINPFSFWRSIYINPANHSATELDAILEHEQIHVNELHTLDILLAEISAIFYWFNPGIWLMKRAIRENIEFITDRKILQKGVDSKAYQYSLLSVNFGAQSNAIVNHFNISTIKKRIIMMNAKRSSNVNITRYLFLIPAVMVLLLVFSVSKAEIKRTMTKSSKTMMNVIKLAVKQMDFTDEEKLATPTTAALSHKAPVRKKAPELVAVSSSLIDVDTLIRNGKIISIDTNKRFNIKLRGVNAIGAEPVYFIDGVKIEHGGMESINPDKIQSINIIKDASAMPNGAIYITTKAGTDTMINGKMIKRVFINGKASDKKDLKEVTVTGYGTTNKLLGKLSEVMVSSPGDIKKVVVDGDTVYSSNIQVISTARPSVRLKALTGVQVRRDTSVSGNVLYLSNTPRKTVKGVPLTTTYFASSSVKIDDMAGKLIILNGKVVTEKEFKKISPDKILTVNMLDGDAGKSLYGDKGKKGVAIIVTKK